MKILVFAVLFVGTIQTAIHCHSQYQASKYIGTRSNSASTISDPIESQITPSPISIQESDKTAKKEEPKLEKYKPIKDKAPIKKFSFQRYFTKDKFNRQITFYLSKRRNLESKIPLPLVVCIQGSGSQSIFLEIETNNGKLIGSGGPESVIARYFREQVRVLVVEKPGVKFLVQPKHPGTATESNEEFRREFTLDRWVEAIHAATTAAMSLDEVKNDSALILGHSEGGQVACQLASVNSAVTHVAVMAGGGPTQVFDFLQLARMGHLYDPNAKPQERVDSFIADWKKVQKDPMAIDKFILGHPHRRWTTFLRSSPIEAILKSKAKVFIAQGTKDTNSLPASAEVLYAELLARGRKCRFLRVEGGDHAFMIKGDKGAGWTKTNRAAVKWYLQDIEKKK